MNLDSVGWDPGKGLWRKEFLLRAIEEMNLKLRFSQSPSLGFYLFIGSFISLMLPATRLGIAAETEQLGYLKGRVPTDEINYLVNRP